MKHAAKILIFDSTNHALVIYRSNTRPHFPFEADLPGDEIEPGEDALAAIKREVLEEVNLDITLATITLANQRTTSYGRNDSIFTTTLAETKPRVALSWEHHSYKWIEKSKLLESLNTKDDYMTVVREYLL